MYTPGRILYFIPFYFKNGNPAKNKYFVVVATDGNNLLISGLPTSKDHIPSFIKKEQGCINDDFHGISCYFIQKLIYY